MPLYEYRCDVGHTFEVMQKMSDEPVQSCQVCGVPVQRVFHPVAVHFKGSGFYNTDYGKKRRGGGTDDSSSSDGDSKPRSDSKTDSSPKKSETSASSTSSSASSD
jgi:putative FmdB family regulatory protein